MAVVKVRFHSQTASDDGLTSIEGWHAIGVLYTRIPGMAAANQRLGTSPTNNYKFKKMQLRNFIALLLSRKYSVDHQHLTFIKNGLLIMRWAHTFLQYPQGQIYMFVLFCFVGVFCFVSFLFFYFIYSFILFLFFFFFWGGGQYHSSNLSYNWQTRFWNILNRWVIKFLSCFNLSYLAASRRNGICQ